MRRLSALAAARGRTARVSLRVNPDIDPRSHPYISTGLRENKFGVDIREAPAILRARCVRLPGVEIVGPAVPHRLADHRPRAPGRGRARAGRALASAAGRGLPAADDRHRRRARASTTRAAPRRAPEALAERVAAGAARVCRSRCCWSRAGRWWRPPGVLLTRVLFLKENRGKTFVIVDAGMNDLLRPALYQAFHRIEPVRDAGGAPSQRVDVVGPVCETGDFLARDRELAAAGAGRPAGRPRRGRLRLLDGLELQPAPAARPRSLVEDGELRLIRRRETFEDLVRTEVYRVARRLWTRARFRRSGLAAGTGAGSVRSQRALKSTRPCAVSRCGCRPAAASDRQRDRADRPARPASPARAARSRRGPSASSRSPNLLGAGTRAPPPRAVRS